MWPRKTEVAQLEREVRKIKANNDELLRQIERLRHDEAYIEKVAREELGLVRPKELVFEYVK